VTSKRTNLPAFAVLLALLLGACGSGSSGEGLATLEGGGDPDTSSGEPAPSEGAGSEVDVEEAMLAFTECLREEGLDVSDPEFDDRGNFRLRSLFTMGEEVDRADRETLRTGFEACAHLIEGVAQRFMDIDRTEIEDRLVEYAACMRENGYDMPDPDLGFVGGPGQGPGGGGEGAGGGPFGDIDPDDPDFRRANEVCLAVFGGTIGPGGFGPRPGPPGDGS
jgi:hypothetical protein